jgi:N-acyl-D-amino-acid deacylase
MSLRRGVVLSAAADFDHPAGVSDGILETWMNGQSAYVYGEGATLARAGRLLTRSMA